MKSSLTSPDLTEMFVTRVPFYLTGVLMLILKGFQVAHIWVSLLQHLMNADLGPGFS